MTKDELKNMLEDYWFDNQYLQEKSKEIEKIKIQTNNTIDRFNELNKNNVTSSELNNQLKLIIDAHLDEEKKILSLMHKKQFIENLIQNISQPYRTIFYFKYICFLNFDQIAGKMSYSTKRIYQLHNEGMDKLLCVVNKEKIDISKI